MTIIGYEMILFPFQLQNLSGGYVRAKDQLAELRGQGFLRARTGRNGKVLLELAHYDAVCSGHFGLADQPTDVGRPVPTRDTPGAIAGRLVHGRILTTLTGLSPSIDGNRAQTTQIDAGTR